MQSKFCLHHDFMYVCDKNNSKLVTNQTKATDIFILSQFYRLPRRSFNYFENFSFENFHIFHVKLKKKLN